MPYSEKGRSEHERIFNKPDPWDRANVKHGVECPYEKDGKHPQAVLKKITAYQSFSTNIHFCYEPISKDCCLCKKYPCVTVNAVMQEKV